MSASFQKIIERFKSSDHSCLGTKIFVFPIRSNHIFEWSSLKFSLDLPGIAEEDISVSINPDVVGAVEKRAVEIVD